MRPGDDYAEYDLSPGALRILQESAPKPLLPALIIGLVTVLYQGIMRYADLPANVAPGEWLGFVALPSDRLPGLLPPLWSFCLRALQSLGISALHAAPVLAVLCSALAAGAVALIAILLMQHHLRRARSATCIAAAVGATAGCMFSLSFPAAISRYSPGPETLHTALALLAASCFLVGYKRPGLPLSLIVAGVFLGAACVEQPYFLMLALVLFFALFLLGEDDGRQGTRVATMLFGMLFVILSTILQLLREGVETRTLLNYFLSLSYPDVNFMPTAFPQTEGGYPYYGTVVLLLLSAIAACFFRRLRPAETVTLLTTAALLGPAMPYLTPTPELRLVPQDFISPALTAVGLIFAAGFAGAGAFLASARLRTWYFLPMLVLTLLPGYLILFETADRAPAAQISKWPAIAQELTATVPEGSLLLTGEMSLASTLWAMQSVEGFRKDLRVLPVTWLTNRKGRAAANKILGPEFLLAEEFPTPADIDRWREALPLHIATLNAGDPDRAESDLLPFALWDVVAQEALHGPVYFAGVDAPWLLARGTPVGHLLVYPAENSVEKQSEFALGWNTCPGCFPAMADLLRPINHANAVAGFVRGDTTENTLPIHTRAASEIVQRLLKEVPNAIGVLTDSMKNDTDQLWKHDRLFQLRTFYEAFTAAPNAEAEAWYQLAAVYAQLGLWEHTGDTLNKWLEKVTDGNGPPLGRLAGDGRFTLFQQRSSALADVR